MKTMFKKFVLFRVCDLITLANSEISIGDRLIAMFKSILTFSPFVLIAEGLNLWFTDNIKFFSFTIVTIMFSMLIGGYMHWKRGSFSLEQLISKTIKITIITIFAYIVLEFVVQIIGIENIIGNIFERTLQVATILFPGSKVLKNLFILSDGKHPPEFVMKRLYNFQKTGNLKEFTEFKAKIQEEKAGN